MSIVGAGAVGSTLGALLFEKGFEVVSIINRTLKPALALGKVVRSKTVSTSVADISPETDLLVVSVSDNMLAGVLRECARYVHTKRLLALHTSGVHSLEVMKPLQRVGALVGSLHPIQSFPKTKTLRERIQSVKGISFGVEGDKRALERIKKIVRVLDGKSVVIPKGMKPLYHVACVFASNYVVALLNAVDEAAQSMGLRNEWRQMILPLFSTTVENALRLSPRGALTGPITRNDVQAIQIHMDALGKFAPQLLPVYSVLGIETARIARQSGKLTTEQFQHLVGTIRHHINLHLNRKQKNRRTHR